MNKKLLALMAVAAVGVSVAGATPQTQFNKGEFLSLIHILDVYKRQVYSKIIDTD